MKTHFHNVNQAARFGRTLFCSGRHMDIAQVSSNLDDVDCGQCRRKLVKLAAGVAR